jgi:malate dehydrogenase (oxaloacetate-decarboxylating)|tara:strand:+ start:5552 stop:6811 length:1260 start_codon:yes stop_codon:yes gene_type:complete
MEENTQDNNSNEQDSNPEPKPDYNQLALEMHEENKGKLAVKSKVSVNSKLDLSTAYTPGVAEPCRKIAENKEDVYKYTLKGNTVAVISDGSAVLGLGNIGPEASLPVMEGKCVLFKEFADIDAFPICIKDQDTKKTIETIKNISPVFGGINLEDFKAPECFEIEQALQDLGIPVMHDDQHGTAVVTLAGLINALKVTDKQKEEVKVVISGTGAAGVAIAKLLLKFGFKHLIMLDSKGIIYEGRENLNPTKEDISKITNHDLKKGDLNEALKNSDIFIGVSQPNIVNQDMIHSMNPQPIIFALSNPIPEIMPDLAKEAGAKIIATGRSDFPNQVNNVLGFPGIFKGALEIKAKRITDNMKLAAAEALANIVETPTSDEIIPYALDKTIVPKIAEAVKQAYLNPKTNNDSEENHNSNQENI